MKYLIWATDRQEWWAPERCGYTRDETKAGRYSGEDVADILANDVMNEQRVCRENETEMMRARIAHEVRHAAR